MNLKNIILVLPIMAVCLTTLAQQRSNATSNAPKGTYLKGNKLMLKKGYSATPVKDSKIIKIQALQSGGGLGAMAAVICSCTNDSETGCDIISGGGFVQCQEAPYNCSGCKMTVITTTSDLALALNGNKSDDADIKWKPLNFPKTTKNNNHKIISQ